MVSVINEVENILSGAVCFTFHLTSMNQHAFIAASVSNCFATSLGLTITVTRPDKII